MISTLNVRQVLFCLACFTSHKIASVRGVSGEALFS